VVKIPHSSFYRRTQPDVSHLVRASLDSVNGSPDSETGWYGTLHYTGCETRARAEEIRKALYRAARYFKVSMAVDPIVADPDGTFRLIYRAINKEHARAYVKAKYGKDPSNWPYRPGGK
jgi:hypothetical protein